jgi:phosphoadenosine phosphosulfate reductase
MSALAADQVRKLSAAFPQLDLPQRVAMISRNISGRIVFTTSFGTEDQTIADAIFTQDLAIEVVTLDTGRLFPETYDVWARTEDHYGERVEVLYPEREHVEALVARQGVNGFHASVEARQACCSVRKLELLERALAGAAAWVTGIRADQSPERASTPFAVFDDHYQVLKVNPLVDWARDRVVDYALARSIPVNSLHDRGFLTIGCAPCTRAVAPGEPERTGRWWWEPEGAKECGLHPEYFARVRERLAVRSAAR